MKRHILLEVIAISTLSGCYSYPRLAEPGTQPVHIPAATTDMDAVLVDAAKLQGEYSKGYREAARFADFSQLPIIGAAAAAAWVLLDNKTGAATLAGKIGIGAGAYSAARGQLSASGLADTYIAGHGALTCLLSHGSLFTGTTAKAQYGALTSQLQTIADAIEALEGNLALTPSDAATADQATLTAAKTLARQTITQARTAEQASLTQAAAFDTAPQIFRVAEANISVRVASRGRVRPSIDFATLRDGFVAAPKTSKTGTSNLNTVVVPGESFLQTADTATMVGNITRATSKLVTTTVDLSASTPHYVENLAAVAACPASIGS